MKVGNIVIKGRVDLDPSSSINNLILNDGVKISKRCSIFGSEKNILEIGENSYIGMNTIINGFNAKVIIGNNVSIAQSVNIMSDSGPNASPEMQVFFPIETGPVKIGDHCWLGANSIIMPNVTLGDFCVVAANSFVSCSFESHSVVGGNPAKLIRKLK
ncbi:acyltransferase [Marinobacterium iners]|uniref:Galactoside O-acetyltransferase n=1 Tax=Marinobacterium iners DSM 11526 TaxID=1122198 RepID=A0A1H4BWF0_9GAMM|nr:acyltransferase [Marinobacterium iners]SEA52466.1 galactoside O-acetyltransferase [Marinobacterium iners DSM 11526]